MTKQEKDKIKKAYNFLKSLGKFYNGCFVNTEFQSEKESLKDKRLINEVKIMKEKGYAPSETWEFGDNLVKYILPRLKVVYDELKQSGDDSMWWVKYLKNIEELIWYIEERNKSRCLKSKNKKYIRRYRKAEKLLPLLFELWW